MNEFKSLGFMKNTLVIFTSDNGPPFPNGRTNIYEPAIRVPLIIHNPLKRESKMKVGNLNNVIVILIDWFLSIYRESKQEWAI